MMKKQSILWLLAAGLVLLAAAGCTDDRFDEQPPVIENTGGGEEEQPGEELPSSSYNEPYRPQVHYTPARNWINDPNGLVYDNGTYHLFYQYNPQGNDWGNMSWGHATSADLLHWKEQPVAMRRNEWGDIFSGSAVIDADNTAGFGAGAMVALYTSSGERQQQSLAYSTDGGMTFTQYAGNPVIANSDRPDFRDPKVFWHAESKRWIMALALGNAHGIAFYGSPDLKNWTPLSTFTTSSARSNIGQWECPDLLRMPYKGGTKWVLIVSNNPGGPAGGSGTEYFVGDFDGTTFTADELDYPLWLDYGPDNYAGVTWSNVPDGRTLFIGWMNNWNYSGAVPASPWRSAMTLPRELRFLEIDGSPVLANSVVAEGLGPFGDQRRHVRLDGVEGQLAALVLPEIQNAVDQPFEDSDVLVGQPHQGRLAFGQVVGMHQLLHRVGDQRQRGAQVVRDVGEEGQLGLRGLLQLQAEPVEFVALALQLPVLGVQQLPVPDVGAVGAQQHEDARGQQKRHQDHGIQGDGLREVSAPVVVHAGLEPLHLLGLLFERLVLQKENLGIRRIDRRGCREDQVAFVGLPPENGQGRADQLMPFGRVEEGGVDDAVGHGADADFGGGVDSDDLQVVHAAALGSPGGGHGHPVVVGIDGVRIGMAREQGVGDPVAVGVVPVAVSGAEQLHIAAGGDDLPEALLASDGGRGALQPADLDDAAGALPASPGEAGRGTPDFEVVGPLVGRIGVAEDVAVEEDDRNAGAVDLRNDGGERLGFVGRGDDDIEALLREIADIGDLPVVVVVRRPDLDLDIVVKKGLAANLLVHLLAPVVGTALRDADPELFRRAASRQQHDGQHESPNSNMTHGSCFFVRTRQI